MCSEGIQFSRPGLIDKEKRLGDVCMEQPEGAIGL
jgi:hypothetical protein